MSCVSLHKFRGEVIMSYVYLCVWWQEVVQNKVHKSWQTAVEPVKTSDSTVNISKMFSHKLQQNNEESKAVSEVVLGTIINDGKPHFV